MAQIKVVAHFLKLQNNTKHISFWLNTFASHKKKKKKISKSKFLHF